MSNLGCQIHKELLGPEAAEHIKSLTATGAELKKVDSGNRQLYDEIQAKYKAVLAAITAKLRGSAISDKTPYIALKRQVFAKQAEFLKRFPEFQAEEAKQKAAAKMQKRADKLFEKLDSTDQIPSVDAEQFKTYWHRLPFKQKKGYLDLLKQALNRRSDPVAVLTGFKGALFELSRKDILEQQGLEILEEYDTPIVVPYLGYDKSKPGEFSNPPNKHLGGDTNKGDIHIDVQGISRDGKPFVYETKSATRKCYGAEYGNAESVAARNQLLKYQQAINDGKIAGATVEVTGRVDYDFLVWAVGAGIASEGAVPDVEILYNLTLPSGREFRFVLKKGTNGLKFENSRSDYTVDDKIVIRGLAHALRDLSIIKILQDVNIPTEVDHPLVTAAHIADPPSIRDVEVYAAYHEMRTKNILELLEDKAIDPDEAEKIASYDERVTPEFVMGILESLQATLNANPELKASKSAYVIGPEQYDEVVQAVMVEVGKIKEYEASKLLDKAGKRAVQVREIKGYQGPKEGYALDVDHVLMDVMQRFTKTGEGQKPRSYDDLDRFINLTDLKAHLDDADRTYMEMIVHDAQSETDISTIVTGTRAVKKGAIVAETRRNMALENLRRSETRLNRLLKRYEKLHALKNRENRLDDELSAEYRALQSQLSKYHMGGKAALKEAKDKLVELEAKKKAALAPLQATMKDIRQRIATEGPEIKKEVVGQLRSVSESFMPKIFEAKQAIADVYKTQIFPSEWSNYTQREVSFEDANFMKFIYIINAEGEVILEEERIRGAEDSSRAAHSELARGRNVYAAGELGFKKDENGKWELIVINNGSGHYRPSQDTLPYAKNVIMEQLGLTDDASVELRNCIFRGVDIDGLPLGFR